MTEFYRKTSMPPKTHVKSAVIQQQKITTENSYDNLDLINQCLKIMIFHAYKNSALPFDVKYNHTSRPIFPMINYKSCYSFHIYELTANISSIHCEHTVCKKHPRCIHCISIPIFDRIIQTALNVKSDSETECGKGGKKHYIFLQGASP